MVLTNKQQYNKRHGFNKDEPHSKKEISKISKIPIKILDDVYSRGEGAYFTNPSSVRKSVSSSDQWAMARVYSFVNKIEGSRKLNHDTDLFEKIKKK